MGINNDKYEKQDINKNCEDSPYTITAENFNEHFLKIAGNISDKIKSNNNLHINDITYSPYNLSQNFNLKYKNIRFQNTSTSEIIKIIKNLPSKNSCGYDEIPIKLIKMTAPFISSPLACIINRSLSTCVFPNRLKYSIVTPIYICISHMYKKGDKNNVSNFWPISLLPSFSKIFERVIYNRLMDHLHTNNILTNSRSGFRKNASTTNAIYKLTNYILMALNNKKKSCGIFFDLEKAFDCIDHEILMTKMKYYGINGRIYSPVESCLENRY
jgi:hypothetical protein